MAKLKTHIAILYRDYLIKILEGKKTIESRFSKVKSIPFGKVSIGDKILLKITSGPICGEAIVDDVKYFNDLTPTKVVDVVQNYKEGLQIEEDFLKMKMDSKYATLIFLKNVQEIKPYNIEKRDRRGWVILEKERQLQFF